MREGTKSDKKMEAKREEMNKRREKSSTERKKKMKASFQVN